MEARGVKYEQDQHRILVEILAHDGGDGVSEARIMHIRPQPSLAAQGVVLPTQTRVALMAERPQTLTIAIPDDTCGVLRIYACNRAGHVCSQQVTVPACQRESDDTEGQEFEVGLEDD